MLLVLDRFRPSRPRGEGSAPWHWILDEAGARIVAEHKETERRRLKWSHATALALADSSKLRHRIEVNEFFARLAEELAAVGGWLSEWYSERTTQHLFNTRLIPDGYAVLQLPHPGIVVTARHFLGVCLRGLFREVDPLESGGPARRGAWHALSGAGSAPICLSVRSMTMSCGSTDAPAT
jgi:hypothetical protein